MTKELDEKMRDDVISTIDGFEDDRIFTDEGRAVVNVERAWVEDICERANKPQLKMFLCDSLKGHWPVGGEAIVIAEDIDQAVELLQRQVELEGMPQQTVRAEQLEEVPFATPKAIIINSGDY